MTEVRLNKYLSDRGLCSRREADRLIRLGKVLVDGKPAETGMKINCRQTVIFNGQEIAGMAVAAPVWLIVNKPRGIVCTTSPKDKAKTIVELVNYPERIYPVGRLDKDSEGLILMTNQGDLVNKMMRSKNLHEKEYHVSVDREITDAFIKGMAAGVYLKELDTTTLPCRIEKTGSKRFCIILTQGLNRQIRRMCQVFGYQVIRLKRVRIMNIPLGDLPLGGHRALSGNEYRILTKQLEFSTNLSYEESSRPLSRRTKKEDYHAR